MAERILATLLKEIAKERLWNIVGFSDDWIFRITTGDGEVAYVFGYDFPINNACARQLAKDKAGTADILHHVGIPCVGHRLFLPPSMGKYVSASGNWKNMIAYAEKHNWDIVIKPNIGTGGNRVERVRTPKELEHFASDFFSSECALCLSPYETILRECRVVMLDDEALLVYEKIRPSAVGDGISSVGELVLRSGLARTLSELPSGKDLTRIPKEGEVVYFNWRHNLGQGSYAKELGNKDAEHWIMFSRKTMRALGLRFASVDCIETAEGIKILEINAGVMMEVYARQSAESREKAKIIYEKALEKYFSCGRKSVI